MLSEKQRVFIRSVSEGEYKYYVAAGEPGSGKTHAVGYAITYHAVYRPGGYYIIAAQSSEAAQSNLGKVIKEAIEELGGTWTEYRSMQRPRIEAVFNNQEMVEFRFFGGKDKDSAASIQGRNASGVVIDEVGLVHRDFYMEARKRMRDGEGTVMLCNFNKLKKRHWTSQELYYNERPNKSVTDWYTVDNDFLPDDYVEEMEDLNVRSRRSDGFYISENAVYPNDIVSTVDSEPDVYNEDGFVSIDYGAGGVTSVLFVRPDTDRWIVDDSIYIDAKLDGWKSSREIADMILDRWPSMYKGVIDHNAVDLKNILRQEGIAIRLAKKDVEQGISITQSLLAKEKLVINSTCEELLDELDEYELNPETDKPIKKNDHCVDALRYAAMELRYI